MNASNLIVYIIQFQFRYFRQNFKAMVMVPYFIFLFIYILPQQSNLAKTFDNNIVIWGIERVWVRLYENFLSFQLLGQIFRTLALCVFHLFVNVAKTFDNNIVIWGIERVWVRLCENFLSFQLLGQIFRTLALCVFHLFVNVARYYFSMVSFSNFSWWNLLQEIFQ